MLLSSGYTLRVLFSVLLVSIFLMLPAIAQDAVELEDSIAATSDTPNQIDFLTRDEAEALVAALEEKLSDDFDRKIGIWYGINANLITVTLGLMAFIVGSYFAVSAFVRRTATDAAVREARETVRANLIEMAHASEIFGQARTFARIGHTSWEPYRNQFRKIIRLEFDIDPLDLRLADASATSHRVISGEGLNMVQLLRRQYRNELDELENKDVFNLDKLEAQIRNNFLFLYLIELLCKRNDGSKIPNEAIWAVSDNARECIKLVKDYPYELWYEVHDTAAKAMMIFGAESEKDRAKQIVDNIVAKKKPSRDHPDAPAKRIEKIKDDFQVIVSNMGAG